jgi:hypothetical protein
MIPVPPLLHEGTTSTAVPVVFARDQPEYDALPALIYPEGYILIEWTFTEAERALIAQGENLRHWIYKPARVTCAHCGAENPCLLQPVKLELTHEQGD